MWRWNMQIAIWARLVFVQNHPNRKIVCPPSQNWNVHWQWLRGQYPWAGVHQGICQKDRFLLPFWKSQLKNTCSRGAGLRICHKDQFLFPSELRGEELWQMKIRPKVEKRWHSPVPSPDQSWEKPWEISECQLSIAKVWVMKEKAPLFRGQRSWFSDLWSSCLTNVVCDSSRGQICNGGAKVCHGCRRVSFVGHNGVIRTSVMRTPHCHYLII